MPDEPKTTREEEVASILKFVPAPNDVELSTGGQFVPLIPKFVQPKNCPHSRVSLDDGSGIVYCSACGVTLDAFATLLRYAKSYEKAKRTLEAAKKFDTQQSQESRERWKFERERMFAREQKREDRLRACGVKITDHGNGSKSYDYPEGWVSLKHAEAMQRKTQRSPHADR